AGRAHVALDAEPATPDGQQAAEPVDQPLAPARRERRRAAAEEPAARLGRQRVHRHEWVDPASVRGRDEEVAALRQMLLAGRLDPEAEHAEEQDTGDDADHAIEERRAGLGLSPEPVEALAGAAARGGQCLGADARPRSLPGRSDRVRHVSGGASSWNVSSSASPGVSAAASGSGGAEVAAVVLAPGSAAAWPPPSTS